jgi:hypothetical protein
MPMCSEIHKNSYGNLMKLYVYHDDSSFDDFEMSIGMCRIRLRARPS